MSNIDKHAELRKELSNPAIGSNAHLRKLALALLDEIAELEQRHCGTALLEREEMHTKTLGRMLDELDAKDKSIDFLKDQLAQLANFNPDWDKLEAATDSLREHMAKLSSAEKRIAELEAREMKPVAWMRNANVTSFMSRFTTDEKYAVEQWGDDAVALYPIPVSFTPACFTDERNLMHINERGRETSLIWSEQNSDSGDIKLFRIAAAAGKGE